MQIATVGSIILTFWPFLAFFQKKVKNLAETRLIFFEK